VPFAPNEASTIEKPYGWVFFYNSKAFLESGNVLHRLAGNGPIVVNKNTGNLEMLRATKPIQATLQEYERSLQSG